MCEWATGVTNIRGPTRPLTDVSATPWAPLVYFIVTTAVSWLLVHICLLMDVSEPILPAASHGYCYTHLVGCSWIEVHLSADVSTPQQQPLLV